MRLNFQNDFKRIKSIINNRDFNNLDFIPNNLNIQNIENPIEKVQQLKESVQTSDFINIKAAAHFLKSSFNVMGLKSTQSLIEMEHLSIQQSNIEKISELLKEVVIDFDESVVEYKRILSIVTAPK